MTALAKAKPPRSGGRKRQAQVTLPQGQWGPDTSKGSPQMHNAEIVPMHEKGGNWYFKRRLHPLGWMVRRISPDGKKKPQEVTVRQHDAGMEMWKRYVETQRSGEPPWYRPFIDNSPKGEVHQEKLNAVRAYRELEALIPEDALLLVRFVVCFERGLEEWTSDAGQRAEALDRLGRVLDRLADWLRY